VGTACTCGWRSRPPAVHPHGRGDGEAP